MTKQPHVSFIELARGVNDINIHVACQVAFLDGRIQMHSEILYILHAAWFNWVRLNGTFGKSFNKTI